MPFPGKLGAIPRGVSGACGGECDGKGKGRRETAAEVASWPEHPAGPAWGGVSSGRARGPGGSPEAPRDRASRAAAVYAGYGERGPAVRPVAPAPATARGAPRDAQAPGEKRAAAEPPSSGRGRRRPGVRRGHRGRLALPRVRVAPSQPLAGENLLVWGSCRLLHELQRGPSIPPLLRRRGVGRGNRPREGALAFLPGLLKLLEPGFLGT